MKLNTLRAANIRFIPVDADEILYHLMQAEVVWHGKIAELVETTELRILRRYMAACLYQGNILQRPPVPENIPNQNGEMVFPFSIESAISDSLVRLWMNEHEEDRIRRARAEWIMRSLYIDAFGWGSLLSLPGVKQHELDSVALSIVGLISQAINLAKANPTKKERSPQGQFFDWLFKRVLQRRCEANPELIKAIAENFKTVLLENTTQLPRNDSTQEITWWLIQQLYLDLPQPIQEELARDSDFMTKIRISFRTTFEVHNFPFNPDEFFEAAHKAMNGKKARITPIEFEKHILLYPSKKSEKRKAFYFYHPETNQKMSVDDERFELLFDAVEEREAVLRRHREWFDCSTDDFEEQVARITLLENPRQRFEEVETWQRSSAAMYYARLSRKLRSQEYPKVRELIPQHIEGLLRHLRLTPDIESGETFQKALVASVQALIDEESLLTAITRLAG